MKNQKTTPPPDYEELVKLIDALEEVDRVGDRWVRKQEQRYNLLKFLIFLLPVGYLIVLIIYLIKSIEYM